MLRTFTFTSSAVLWWHPDGMLLKLTMLRSTAGVNWTGTESVKEPKRKQRSKLIHHPKSFSFLIPFSWARLPFSSYSEAWPLLIRFQSLLWRFGVDIAVDCWKRCCGYWWQGGCTEAGDESEQAAHRWGVCRWWSRCVQIRLNNHEIITFSVKKKKKNQSPTFLFFLRLDDLFLDLMLAWIKAEFVKNELNQMFWRCRSCDFSWGLAEVVKGLVDPRASVPVFDCMISDASMRENDAGNSK